MSLIEGKRPGEYLIHEESCHLSRDDIVLAGGDHVDGTVLGKKTSDETFHQLAPGANDGTQLAAGVLRGNVDASSGDAEAIAHTALSVVRDENLTWPTGITANQKNTAIKQLAVLHIKVK
jgi:hypothetical protein